MREPRCRRIALRVKPCGGCKIMKSPSLATFPDYCGWNTIAAVLAAPARPKSGYVIQCTIRVRNINDIADSRDDLLKT